MTVSWTNDRAALAPPVLSDLARSVADSSVLGLACPQLSAVEREAVSLCSRPASLADLPSRAARRRVLAGLAAELASGRMVRVIDAANRSAGLVDIGQALAAADEQAFAVRVADRWLAIDVDRPELAEPAQRWAAALVAEGRRVLVTPSGTAGHLLVLVRVHGAADRRMLAREGRTVGDVREWCRLPMALHRSGAWPRLTDGRDLADVLGVLLDVPVGVELAELRPRAVEHRCDRYRSSSEGLMALTVRAWRQGLDESQAWEQVSRAGCGCVEKLGRPGRGRRWWRRSVWRRCGAVAGGAAQLVGTGVPAADERGVAAWAPLVGRLWAEAGSDPTELRRAAVLARLAHRADAAGTVVAACRADWLADLGTASTIAGDLRALVAAGQLRRCGDRDRSTSEAQRYRIDAVTRAATDTAHGDTPPEGTAVGGARWLSHGRAVLAVFAPGADSPLPRGGGLGWGAARVLVEAIAAGGPVVAPAGMGRRALERGRARLAAAGLLERGVEGWRLAEVLVTALCSGGVEVAVLLSGEVSEAQRARLWLRRLDATAARLGSRAHLRRRRRWAEHRSRPARPGLLAVASGR